MDVDDKGVAKSRLLSANNKVLSFEPRKVLGVAQFGDKKAQAYISDGVSSTIYFTFNSKIAHLSKMAD